jgi:thiol-disulfide isomerase/thioredoxin
MVAMTTVAGGANLLKTTAVVDAKAKVVKQDAPKSGDEDSDDPCPILAKKGKEPPAKPSAMGFSTELPLAAVSDVVGVKATAAREKKPVIVIVTETWCPACQNLVKSMNKNHQIKNLWDKFVTVNAMGDDGQKWQPANGKREGYIPRIYFLSPQGVLLDIKGHNAKSPHFFPTGDHVASGMQRTLQAVMRQEM